MDSWFQICNLRTTLLHLQFIHAELKEQIEEQEMKVSRAHRDRLMQYALLWQDYLTLQQSNFKKLIIIKLQSCIAAHQGDEELWQLLDHFKTFANAVEQQMLQNLSKLYIGKSVLFDIREVQAQLVQIQAKITSFLHKYSSEIEQYNQTVMALEEVRDRMKNYLTQVTTLYKEIEGGYGSYLRKRLQRRSRQIDSSIQQLKSALIN